MSGQRAELAWGELAEGRIRGARTDEALAARLTSAPASNSPRRVPESARAVEKRNNR
jgi:hypothetical protein